MGLCNDFVDVHRRLAQLESLLPEEELPPPPAKRQCTTQVVVTEPTAGPPPEPTEGCGSQPSSATPSAQGCRCSKGHLLKRAVAGTWRGGLVCDGPCGRSLRSNMARWSCAACDFDLCAARHPSHRTRPPVSLRPTPELIACTVVAGAQSALAPSRPARHPAPPRQAGSGAGPAAAAAAAASLPLHARLRLRCCAHSRRRRHRPTRPPDRSSSSSSSSRSRGSRGSQGNRLPTAHRPSTGWLSHSHRRRYARISKRGQRSQSRAHCRRSRRSRRSRSRSSRRNLGTSSMRRLRRSCSRSPNRSRSRSRSLNHSCSRS